MTRTPLARWRSLYGVVVVMVCNICVRGVPICPNDTSDGPAVPGDIANDMCNCHQGWGGPGTCGVCQNDAVCQAKLGAPNAICSTDKYAAVKDIQAWCDVRASDITRFYIPRPSLAFGYNVNGSLWFEFFKRSMMAFRCESDHTRMSVDKEGLIHYTASDLRCVATCEKMDDDLCRAMHGAAPMITPPADIICDTKGQTCTVYEEVLKDQLGASNGVGLINCMMAECILPGQTPMLPPFEPTPKPRPPAAETACVALAWIWLCAIAGMLGIAASYYFGGGKMQYCSSYARAMQAGLGPQDSKMEMLSPLGDSMTDDESAPPTTYTLVWDSLCYTVGSRKILKNVSGVARPGELLAVMGASGCGKTTLVDIIALKRKSGTTTGQLMYNNERALGQGNAHMSCGGCYGDVRSIGPINGGITGRNESPRYPTADNDVSSSRSALKDVVGFVDQEDYLKGTLTVFEAVLFSASLRLPASMHFTTKVKRSMQVLRDLRISKVADNFIGSEGHRGISGGERRRVSVALELVKVPAVLCLDEPTSGLDSYNARVLVDCLRDLARRRRTTVVMTIHQPRSSVFYSMDRLLVLHEGEMAYYGASHGLVSFLASVGYCMPVGHNPADYLMDLIFGDVATGNGAEGEAETDGVGEKYISNVEEGNGAGGGGVRRRKRKSHSNDDDDEEDGDEGGDGDAAVRGARDHEEEAPLSPPRGKSPLRPLASDRLRTLTQHFQRSEELKALREEMAMVLRPYEPPQVQRPPPSINNTHTDTHTHTPRPPHATSPSSSAYRSPVCATPTHTDVSGAHTALSAPGLYCTPKHTHGDTSTSASTQIHTHGGGDGAPRSPSATDTRTHDPHTRTQMHTQPGGSDTQRRTPSPVQHTNAHTHAHTHIGVRRTASVESGVSAVFSANRTWGALKRWVSEASILSRRSTLELWRNPFLLMSHALAMLYFAMVLGVIYFKLESSGFEALQNRVGILLLSCLFLTFSGISALPLIWLERTLYIHEYSNRFYSRSAYFVTKVFFDLVPLRIAPTIIYAVITNAMIELTGWGHQFVNYLGFLILLVCVSSVISTILGMMTRNIMSGIFIGTMAMIHFIMLSSLFINFKKMRLSWLRWLERVSFFNYALNGVVINELRNLNLTDFPVATGQGVLSYFNIDATEANMYDCMLQLFLYLMVASIVAYGALVIFIRESR